VLKSRKLDENNLIYGMEASRILGICKPTFDGRVKSGQYKIACKRCKIGFKYSILDVFKIAHPTLKNGEIEKFIMDYRMKIANQRKSDKGKRRGKK